MCRAVVAAGAAAVLLAGGGTAFAAWSAGGPGTANARASAVAAPAGLQVSGQKCSGGNDSGTVRWNPVPNATGYTVLAGNDARLTSPTVVVADTRSTSVTVTLSTKPSYVSVVALLDNWQSTVPTAVAVCP